MRFTENISERGGDEGTRLVKCNIEVFINKGGINLGGHDR